MRNSYYVIIIIILLVLVVIARGPVLFQEGNPLPIITGIIRLQFTDQSMVKVSENKLMQKSGEENILDNYLSERGWVFRDGLGAGIFYSRNGEDIFIHSRMFTRRYIVYELDRTVD